jgi:hypothetical protein
MVLKVWGVREKGGDERVFYQPLEVQKNTALVAYKLVME